MHELPGNHTTCRRYPTILMIALTLCLSASSVDATFSIVAYDPDTQEWGIAVASREVAVGYAVPWAEAGAGVVATQAWISPLFGRDGIAMMRAGFTAEQTLKALLERDDMVETRQVALVDGKGNVAVHTGENTGDFHGHRKGKHYSVQGNTLASESVLIEMERAFLEAEGPLALRLVESLRAGDAAGGDKRGRQSASINVVRFESDFRRVTDTLIDLRVDNDDDAINALVEAFEQFTHQLTLVFYLESEAQADVDRGLILLDWLMVRQTEKPKPDPMIYYTTARLMAASGLQPKRAIDLALLADETIPDNSQVKALVADAYFADGNVDKALEWNAAGLKLYPDSKYLANQRERLTTATEPTTRR